MCDPSELPAKVAEARDFGVWEDASGRRVPVTELMSFQGAEHCSWEHITFLHVGHGEDLDQYIRDTTGEFAAALPMTYEAHTTKPGSASDTGFRRDGRQLWLTPERDAAYLVSIDDHADVERWPAAAEPIYCM